MPVPVAAAAVSTVARYLAKNGVTKAIKKYGKKAVNEATKHAKDVTTKRSPGQKKVKKAVSGQRANRETMRRTAGVVGAAGYGAGKMSSNSETTKSKPKAKVKDPRVDPKAYPTYKKQSKPAISFREAQRKAKRNKQKTFTWEGRRYNTTEA